MSSPNAKLLSDLARLATTYGAKDWEELAAWLDDDHRRNRLRSMLLELAAISRTAPKAPPRKRTAKRKRKPSRAAGLRTLLDTIRAEDSERADLLEDIWLKLRQRELLPSVASVRTFAEAIGLKGLEETRRDAAVTELMEHLAQLPGDTLEQRMRETTVEDRKLGEEYERWVELILNRPPGA